MTPTVRIATAADLDGLVERNLALAEESEGKALDRPTVERGVEAILEAPHRGTYRVVEADGAVRGQCLVNEEPSDWSGGRYWWLQSVYVDPEWRGEGLFRALWDAIEADAAGAGDVAAIRLYVLAGNEAARRAYERLGMTESGYRVYEKPLEGPK